MDKEQKIIISVSTIIVLGIGIFMIFISPGINEKRKIEEDIKNLKNAFYDYQRSEAFISLLNSKENHEKIEISLKELKDLNSVLPNAIRLYCDKRNPQADQKLKKLLSSQFFKDKSKISLWSTYENKNDDDLFLNIESYANSRECFESLGWESPDLGFSNWLQSSDYKKLKNVSQLIKKSPQKAIDFESAFRKLSKENHLFLNLADTLAKFATFYRNEKKANFDKYSEKYQQLTYLENNQKSLESKVKEGSGKVFTLNAIIVALIDESGELKLYEITDDIGKRGMLYTTDTSFTTRGYFSIEVSYMGKQKVKLKQEAGGFNQEWPTYVEAAVYKKDLKELNQTKIDISETKAELNKNLEALEGLKILEDYNSLFL